MDKKRIAIVHYCFGFGGAEHMVSELASHIDKSRFDVEVICIYGDVVENEMVRSVKDSGASVVFLEYKGSESRLMGIVRVWRALDAFQPDVVHTHLGAVQYCIPWVVSRGAKLLHTVHNVPEMETPGGIVKKVVSWMYRTGRAVPVAISEQNRHLTARFYGLADDSVAMVNNPVDIDFFCPRVQGESGVYSFDFINVAGLRPQKNQRLLLRAFERVLRRHPESRLCIVGDGTERQALEKLAGELGICDSVKFVGLLTEKAKVRELLWESKTFILSSDYEGLPLSAIEAMACGLPVISTNVGGMVDIIKGNGSLVPVGNLDSLSEAMAFAMDNGFDYAASIRSRDIASLFSVDECAAKYESLYEKCLVSQ